MWNFYSNMCFATVGTHIRTVCHINSIYNRAEHPPWVVQNRDDLWCQQIIKKSMLFILIHLIVPEVAEEVSISPDKTTKLKKNCANSNKNSWRPSLNEWNSGLKLWCRNYGAITKMGWENIAPTKKHTSPPWIVPQSQTENKEFYIQVL